MANTFTPYNGRFTIGGVELINDGSGIRRADGKSFRNTNIYGPDPAWGDISQAIMGGDYSLLGDLAPYGKEIADANIGISSQENYAGAPFLEGLKAWGTVMAAGAGAGALLGTGAAGAGAGATGAFDMGIGGIAESMGLGSGTAAGAGAATGGGMDWWTELGLTPADVGMEVSPWTTNPGMADLTGGVLNNAGSAAGGSIWDTLKNIPTSALKALGGGDENKGLMALLGKLGAAGLGAYGANQQANSLSDLAKQYSEYGAPSRARFEASMSPGFDPMSIPGYSGALDTASKGILARLSATGGNPWGNPGGLIDANKQIIAGTAMPAISEYQRTNLTAGGLGNMNAAIPGLQTGAINADSNVLSALGYGLNAATQQQPQQQPQQQSLTDLMKAFNLMGLA